MVDKYHIDFHLARGPAQLPRLFTLPLNEYSSQTQLFTIGRAVRCNVILDPLLVFASNVQCSICCVPRQGHATPAHHNDVTYNNYSFTNKGNSEESTNSHSERKSSGNKINVMTLEKSAKPSPQFPFQVYLTDMCSSNGTFVNKTRISTSEPTLLHNDDCVIFGGLRDVDIGDKLPDDAFDVCDELIVWKVNMCEEYSHDEHCPSTAAAADTAIIDEVGNNTPNRKYIDTFDKNAASVNNIDVIETKSTTLPSAERLEKEERALLEMVQETLLLKRSACKTSPTQDLQVTSSADSKNVLEKEELQSLSLSLSTAMKKHNIVNANINTTSNVANEYSPMVKQQLFANDTPLRTDGENLGSRKSVGECKKNSENSKGNNSSNSPHVPLHETTANIMHLPSSSSSSLAATTLVNVQIHQHLQQTGMKYTTGKQSWKAGLLLSSSSSSSSPHNVELPPPPLPFSAVRVGKFTFNASQKSVVCHNKSEQRMDLRRKENGKNKSLKRVRSSEELMQLSCTEPTTQNTTKEHSLETSTTQEVILESQDMNTKDIHNVNRNVYVTNSNNSLLEHKEQIGCNKDELYTLSFTSTHWKWRMGNVADDSTTTMNVLLPITSIATLLVCCGDKHCEEYEGNLSVNINNACENDEENVDSAGSRNYSRPTNSNSAHYAGIAVELKDYCQVPLLPKELTQGAKENRWIAWKLKIESECTETSELPQSAESGNHDTQSNMLEGNTGINLLLPSRLSPTHQEASDHSESSTSKKNEHERNETNDNKNYAFSNEECSIRNESEFINDNTKRDEDLVEHSDNSNHWVTVLEKFYAVHNLPQPLYVNVDTFEKVFDPSCLTKTDKL